MDLQTPLTRLPDGMPPSEWGPHYWRVLHTAAEWFRDSPDRAPRDAEAMAWLFANLARAVPCAACSAHAAEFLEPRMHDILASVGDRAAPAVYMWALHNHANRLLGKPQRPFAHSPPAPLAEWAPSFWVFAVTQAALLRGHPERAGLFVDIVDGVAPFMVPDRAAADALARFAMRHRASIAAAAAEAVAGREAPVLRWLEQLRATLVAVAREKR